MNEIIGIIGGNGVAATNKLCEMLEERVTLNMGGYRDAHHPEMIVWQATKAPSRSMFLEGKGETFIPEYIDIASKLEKCGATCLCMCCNTAHFAIDELRKSVTIPFLDIIEATVNEIKRSGKKKIGIMASDGCVKYRIYDKYIDRICKIIYPNMKYQQMVTEGICNIKNKSRWLGETDSARPARIFREVEEYLLQEEQVELVVAGCTDIRVDYKGKGIDSLEVLCDEIIRTVYGNNFKVWE